MPLDTAVEEQDLRRLQSFSKHFNEFWDNWKNIRSDYPQQFTFKLGNDGRVDGGELEISRHRLKGFLADYRKFHLQKDDISFLRIIKIVTRCCRSSELRDLIDYQRGIWLAPNVVPLWWHNRFSADSLLDAYFNEEIFHSDLDSKRNLSLLEIRSKLTEQAILYVAVEIARNRLNSIRNVHWVIAPFLSGKNGFQVYKTKND